MFGSLNSPAVRLCQGVVPWRKVHLRVLTRSDSHQPRRHCSGEPSLHRVMGVRQRKWPDPVERPRLTPMMVTNILQMNEEAVNDNHGPVKSHVINTLQANKPFEDRSIQGRLVQSSASLFSVIDGHSGCACAQAVSDCLLPYIAVAMAQEQDLKGICEGAVDPMRDLTRRHGQTQEVQETDLAALRKENLLSFAKERLVNSTGDNSVPEALVNSFVRLDQDITNQAKPRNWEKSRTDMDCYLDMLAIAFSGAVVCLAYIDGRDLFVANVGDTEAVLGVYSNGRWEAVPLSNAHVANNPREVERITKNHPNEMGNIIKNGRLFGELMPLRAFGDVRFKWAEADLRQLMDMRRIPQTELVSAFGDALVPQKYHTPPYLDAYPEVMHRKLTPKDKFLVLASDGLWDCLSQKTVVELVGGHMDGEQVLVNYWPPEGATLQEVNRILTERIRRLKNRALDSNAATHLLRCALGTDHGQVSAQLTLPQAIVRQYRDDITITIIFFDSDYIRRVNVKYGGYN